MARRRGFLAFGVEAAEDTRPAGALQFADPSMAEMPRRGQTFNEPHSPRASGEFGGIRTMTSRMVPWGDRFPGDPWREMNKKRGVSDDEESE